MVRAICEDDTFASDRILSNDATIPLKSYMTWMSSTTSLSMTAIILFWWERYRSEEKWTSRAVCVYVMNLHVRLHSDFLDNVFNADI